MRNFLAHVAAGDYQNTLIHRSAKTSNPTRDFVIQGGGYRFDGSSQVEPSKYPTTPSCPAPTTPPANPPVICPVTNEPVFPTPRNQRGTLAMAKLGGDPDSASNQWFVNLNDVNASILDDPNNGAFTIFGRVLGNGMSVVDAIAALPRFPFQSAWSEAPMRNYDARQFDALTPVGADNVVVVSVTVLPDGDDDGIANATDNCATVSNPDQANADGDPQGDACDTCTRFTNPSQALSGADDFDHDGIPTRCDSCPTIANTNTDPDHDGVDQACDTCLLQANPVFLGTLTNRTRVSGQLDDDADGRGNSCDFDYDNTGPAITAADFNQAKASVGKAVAQSICGTAVAPAVPDQRCGEFDHDGVGPVVTATDLNRAQAAIGKLLSTAFPACTACSVGAGWSNTLASGNARTGRPICESSVAGVCVYAP